MLTKEIIGGMAVAIGTAAQSFYLWQIFKRGVRPHIFSRIVWGILMLIAFLAQYAAMAGPGCWAIGMSSLLCFIIAGTGFYFGEMSITRSDWVCFIFALSAIPAWVMTKNPLWAVMIVSLIDAASYYPTFRKSWANPRQESMTVFLIYTLPLFLSIAALDNFTLTTVLYPATLFTMNMLLVTMLLYRRRVVI